MEFTDADRELWKKQTALVNALSDLMEATTDLLGGVDEPIPTGRGTDGTLWSDAEHAEYLMAVCAACRKVASRKLAKEGA